MPVPLTMPVLWISGPAGVGKSTVSWLLYTGLAQAGVPVAFADTDQLCMCYPAPPGDPGRQRLKALNLGDLIGGYRAAGARCVIANGVVDPALGLCRDLMPEAALTVCRLRAEPAEIVRRLAARGGSGELPASVISEVEDEVRAMDASDFADVCVDTSGVQAATKVALLVRHACRDWPGFSAASGTETGGGKTAAAAGGPAATAPGRLLLVSGPAGVGKYTIGFSVYMSGLNAGLRSGYIDLDQLGFVSPRSPDDPGHHKLKARNLAAVWRNYTAAGARHVVAVGPVGDRATFRAYQRALPGAAITLCRLHAGRRELIMRIMSRGDGGSWPQPGDPLRGQPGDYLRQVAGRAVADAAALERADIGIRIDTGSRTVAAAAGLVATAAGWPGTVPGAS